MRPTKQEGFGERYTWEEIFTSVDISLVDSKIDVNPVNPAQSVTIRTWQSRDNGQKFVTYDEYPKMHDYDRGLAGEAISKWEVIRQLHFKGNTKLAQRYLEEGGPLKSSTLDELTLLRRDIVSDDLGHLPAKDRYYFDPMLRSQIDDYLQRLESQEEANRQFLESKFALEGQTPAGIRLDSFLSQPDEEESWRVEGLISSGSTTTIVGARKVGKTTFTYNMLDSYLHGRPLLGAFPTNPVGRRLGYVNMELTPNQSKKWFRRSPIGASDKVTVWNLRGMPNPFRSDASTKKFAADVRSEDVEVMFIDPFSGVYTGNGKKSVDNDDVKEFLLKLEAFKVEAGVSELVILVHAGWDGSRSRGASALEDHPDTIITIEADKSQTRFLSAIGRDVEIEEGTLSFDKSTGLLRYSTGAKKVTGISFAKKKILAVLAKHSGLNAGELQSRVGGSKADVLAARQELVDDGLIESVSLGRGKLSFHLTHLATSPMLADPPPSELVNDVAPAYISGAYDDGWNDSLEQYLLPKCEVHEYTTFTFFGSLVTVCGNCFDVTNLEVVGRQ